jgi:hypothetical protein
MTQKQEFKLAYALAGILLVVGIFSYAAYSAEPPDTPLRVMYQTVAGKVLFDHKAHFSPEHFGVSCQDCHHHPYDEPDLRSCVVCHQVVEEESGVPEACLDCHDIDEIEGMEMSKSSDAAHGQCIDCHDEYEAGPVDCNGCHVL